MLGASALVAACATQPKTEEPVEPETEAPAVVATPEPEPVYRPFPEDTLYALLVAEFAARRGEYELALENYSEQAEKTRDPAVVARAARMARYLKKGDSAAHNAELWAQVSPEHPEAQYSAATELGKAGRPMEALPYMVKLDALGGNTNFSALAASSLNIDAADRERMLQVLDGMPPVQSSTNDNDRKLAKAILLQSLDRNEEALVLAQEVTAAQPDHPQAILVEMQIYRNLGDEASALQRMKQAVDAAPDNADLRLQYARVLGRTDLEAAQEQFEILVNQDPENAEYRLSLALVYRENKRFDEMREVLEQLVDDGIQSNAAHLYLAQDAERREDFDAAIRHYLSMTPSQFFAAAIARAGTLLIDQGGAAALNTGMESVRARYPDQSMQLVLLESQLLMDQHLYDDALSLLSGKLENDPTNNDLLYSRSLVFEKLKNIAGAEADLRSIIANDPENSMALNALGYTLTNLTDRYEEALALIQRAIEIKPDDPAIMDSLGWAYYRLGRLDEAVEVLERAYKKFPDHEVAAHLGEVLWVQGQTDEAMKIWQEGLESEPESRVIREAMERLGAEVE